MNMKPPIERLTASINNKSKTPYKIATNKDSSKYSAQRIE